MSFELIKRVVLFLIQFFTVQLQIEEISRKLRTGDLGLPITPEERFDSFILIQFYLIFFVCKDL